MPYLHPLLQILAENAHWSLTKTFQNWMHIPSSTQILQTPMPPFSRSQHRISPGYYTCKKQGKKRQSEVKSYDKAN